MWLISKSFEPFMINSQFGKCGPLTKSNPKKPIKGLICLKLSYLRQKISALPPSAASHLYVPSVPVYIGVLLDLKPDKQKLSIIISVPDLSLTICLCVLQLLISELIYFSPCQQTTPFSAPPAHPDTTFPHQTRILQRKM